MATCLFKHVAMEACWGVEVQSLEFLTATLDGVSVLFHALVALYLRKRLLESIE
jgi:hypothetical protein